MNELQVRLTGDISALQSALTKAKTTLKSFEDSTNKESERGNVGFKRKIGLIEQLTNKSKVLRTALSQATNEKDVIRYNQELEQTIREMTRLNALGRQVSGGLGSTTQGFNKLAGGVTNANGVAIEFSRIIQDAPFGLIGIGNNIQQLTANFAQVSKTAGGAGAAIKASLGALISPANLLVLGISAVTAAFTAYQMGAFDFLKSNEEAAKSVKELADEIDNVQSRTVAEGAKISALRSVIEDETLSREKRLEAVKRLQDTYPTIFANADKEKLLNGELTTSYDTLTKAIIKRAEASLAEEEIVNLNKVKQVIDDQLKSSERQLKIEQNLLATRSKFVGGGQIFSEFDLANARIRDLNKSIEDNNLKLRENQIQTEGFAESIESYYGDAANALEPVNSAIDETKVNISDIFNLNPTDFVGQIDLINKALTEGVISKSEAQQIRDLISSALDISEGGNLANIADKLGKSFDDVIASFSEKGITDIPISITLDPEKLTAAQLLIQDQLLLAQQAIQNFNDKTAQILEAGIENTLGDFAFAIGDALASGANPLKAGGAALLGGLANILNQLGQLAIGSGIAIDAIKTSLAGLVGAPAIIAGVALVALSGAISSKARSLSKSSGGGGASLGGGGGGAGISSGKAPQIFTNQNNAGIPSGNSPNFGGGSIDFANAQSRLTATISGGDLLFTLDRAKERQGNG
jgi:hypothetical protein